MWLCGSKVLPVLQSGKANSRLNVFSVFLISMARQRLYAIHSSCIIFCLLLAAGSSAQNSNRPHNLLFYQLNTQHGLSDNYVNSICTDKNSNLWIGTNERLNRFNGKTVTRFSFYSLTLTLQVLTSTYTLRSRK